MPLNQTGYVILGLLSIEPDLSGYDMRKAIQGSVGYFWGESYGQIYPTLKRLLAEGLIEPGSSTAKGRLRRQTYALTEPGRARLRQWLAVPFRNDPPRNEFLLKLFFGREAAPGVSAAHVRDLQERNQRMRDTLSEIEASAQAASPRNPHVPYWMLTLGLGKALIRAALEWGEGALRELSVLEAAGARSRPKGGGQRKTKGAEPGKTAGNKVRSSGSKARITK